MNGKDVVINGVPSKMLISKLGVLLMNR